MFQTVLPKPSLAVVMPGGMSVMVCPSALDKKLWPRRSAGEEVGDMPSGSRRFLEHQMPGRRHKLKVTVRQRRHPGLRLGGRAQAIVGAPQHQGRDRDA